MHTDICSPSLRHILQIVNFSDKWWKVETVVLVVFLLAVVCVKKTWQ